MAFLETPSTLSQYIVLDTVFSVSEGPGEVMCRIVLMLPSSSPTRKRIVESSSWIDLSMIHGLCNHYKLKRHCDAPQYLRYMEVPLKEFAKLERLTVASGKSPSISDSLDSLLFSLQEVKHRLSEVALTRLLCGALSSR